MHEPEMKANDTQVGGDHYLNMEVEPWDVIDTWLVAERIGFYRGNALKYVMRMGTKDENITEIKKAIHYLNKLVEVLQLEAKEYEQLWKQAAREENQDQQNKIYDIMNDKWVALEQSEIRDGKC